MAQQPKRDGPRGADDRDRQAGAGSAGGSDLSEEERLAAGLSRRRDPGDSVPEGVAPESPAPLTEEDRAVLRTLEELPKRAGEAAKDR